MGTRLQRGDGSDSASQRIFPPFSPPPVQAEGNKAAGERGDYKCPGAGMCAFFLTPLSVI